MPDLDPLPNRPRVPVFTPRTGDYAAMVGRAKHRRRRHLAGAGAGFAGVAVVVAIATGGAGGTFGLEPVRPATTGVHAAGETPAPSATPEPSETPTATTAPGETAAAPNDPAGPTEAAQPAGSAAPGDPGDEQPDDQPPPRATAPVVVRDEVANDTTKVCDTDPSVVTAAGWCLRYDGPASVRAGDNHVYRSLLCRTVGRGAATVTFQTEQQVDFRVTGPNGREEWHWAGGWTFPPNETRVTVPEGRCARWTVQWDATGDDGDLVRPGSYSISPDILVSDWGEGTSGAMVVSSIYDLEITS
jgi:hypothetical protein